MTSLTSSNPVSPANNLCEIFLRDVSLLLVTSQLVKRSLLALRPECVFSPELTETIDTVVALCESGEPRLHEPLFQAGAVLPVLEESSTSAVVTAFMARIPFGVAPAILAAEVIANVRVLVQHLELKAILAAEGAVLIGQTNLSGALLKWSAEWRSCGQTLRAVTVRVRAKAYVADLESGPTPQPA